MRFFGSSTKKPKSPVDQDIKALKGSANVLLGNGVGAIIFGMALSYNDSSDENKFVGFAIMIGLTFFALHAISTSINRRLERIESALDPSRPPVPPVGKSNPIWLVIFGALGGLLVGAIWYRVTENPHYTGKGRWPLDIPFILAGIAAAVIIGAILHWRAKRTRIAGPPAPPAPSLADSTSTR